MNEPFVEDFNSIEDIAKEYGGRVKKREDILKQLSESVVHLAWYGYGDYSGSSLVIFEHQGKLYVVDGGHCSCHGLEDQWNPIETTWKVLSAMKLGDGYEGQEEAQKILDDLCKKNMKKRIKDLETNE